MKQFLVFHPFLFAIFPVLFLFAYNIDEVPATDLLLPMLVVIIGTLILLLSLRLITKNYNKIAIVTTYFLILFFSAGHIMDLIYSSETGGGFIISIFFWGPLWALLFITGAFLVIKARSNFSTFTKFLNVVAITLVGISLINISIYEIKTTNLVPEEINEEGSGLDLSDTGNSPDIYYIILDMYTREDTLKEDFNYDNSEFIDYLTNKGFYVAPKSRSNYPMTPLSLASSLNMEYINYLSDTVSMESNDLTIPLEMIANNKVSLFLESKGYHYIFIGSGFCPPDMSSYADVYTNMRRIGFSTFSEYLIRTTALAPFVKYFIPETTKDKVLFVFDALADMPNFKEPTFVYAHIMCPHGPYIFDHRNHVKQQDKETYLDKLTFVNKKVKTLVDEILSKSSVAPIIILQGDHGFGPMGWNNRFNILNAYYFPAKGYDLLYESVTPVNSFRIVFNLYFDANYSLLKDESYATNYKHPYKFTLLPPEVEKEME